MQTENKSLLGNLINAVAAIPEWKMGKSSFGQLQSLSYQKYWAPKNATLSLFSLCSVNDVQLALAKVIPIVNGLVNTICADTPNQFIQVRKCSIQ